jgi:hypothetical protein
MNYHYECHRNPEPDDNAHLWLVIEYEGGTETDRFYCEDGPGFIAEAIYCQQTSLEERWAADGAREAIERGAML